MSEETLNGLSCATQVPNTDYWNRATVVSDSNVSESVTYGSCDACDHADLTCESTRESCSDIAYTAPSCECVADGNVNNDVQGAINVTDIVALVGMILPCQNDQSCLS